MARLFSSAGWCRLQVALLWVLIWYLDLDEAAECDLQSCTRFFMARDSGVREGPSRPYCLHLRDYMMCLQDQTKACQGDIMFHGAVISVQAMMKDNTCDQILSHDPVGDNSSTGIDGDLHYPSSLNNDPCRYNGAPSNPAHCGLFGDPHLKTFSGTFMTCRVKGAWPMLSSSHLAIQVTNEAVAPDFKATATTKVTVLIKSSGSCSIAKTYEASGDSLPKAFVDGTTYSGSNRSHSLADVTESLSGRHVIINLKSINAAVSIRRIGKYLSVSVTLPEAVVEELSDAMQLCVGGCPHPEQLMGGGTPHDTVVMSEKEALERCLEYNITDYYLDSCVFDLMTTGDLSFREAAALSLKELLTEDPRGSSVLKNCSSWPCVWGSTSGQGRIASESTILVLLVLTGAVSIRSLTTLRWDRYWAGIAR